MWLYDLGDICPLIVTPYEESDMLDYSAAVIGVVVSVTALIYSVIANAIRFRISHAVMFNENDEECVLIRIYNDSSYECDVLSVSIPVNCTIEVLALLKVNRLPSKLNLQRNFL